MPSRSLRALLPSSVAIASVLVVALAACSSSNSTTSSSTSSSPSGSSSGSHSSQGSTGHEPDGDDCCNTVSEVPATVTVLDAATGAPITDATFAVAGDGGAAQGAEEGPNGVYSISNVQTATLLVSAPGYGAAVVANVSDGYDARGCCGGYQPGTASTVKLTRVPDGGSSSTGSTASTGSSTSSCTHSCEGAERLPATVTVEDATTDAPITDATFTVAADGGGPQSATESGDGGLSGVYTMYVDASTLIVSAPGYVSATVTNVADGYDATGCCGGYQAGSMSTVKLTRADGGGGSASSGSSGSASSSGASGARSSSGT
jgi:hypothetical protein